MKTNWTTEQQNAIFERRGGNILVAAGAGSGKTSVLIERILQKITDPVCPVDADRILTVTFTNAAAGDARKSDRQAVRAFGRGPLEFAPAAPAYPFA
jgi:ATP-dependent helicase/nuclease subunit A